MNELEQIIKIIDRSVNNFNNSIPAVQQQLFLEIVAITKSLDVKNGTVVQSAKNIKLLLPLKKKIERLILTDNYKKNTKQFTETFRAVEKLQNSYFSSVVKDYKPLKTLAALREEAVQSAIESLMDAGMKKSVIEPVREILRTNITSGAKYTDLVKNLKDSLLDTKTGEGSLVKYVKQITTDSLNQYARGNIKLVTDDLGLGWYSYNGAIIDGSRDFCRAMHKKKFFHVSEIPKLLKGDFQEFKDVGGKINPKTNLPYGMIAGTNKDNFLVNLGGHSCGHHGIPVDDSVVPSIIREAVSR